MKTKICGMLVFAVVLWNANCLTFNNPEEGVVAGAAGGAIIGSIIGDSPGDTILGAIIGAAIGGAAGAYLQHYMDREAADMRDRVEGAGVERVGEGIRVWFDVGLLFDAGGFELRVSGERALLDLAIVLNRYPDTYVYIRGDADDWSRRDEALALSKRRSRVLGSYLARHDVRPGRFVYRDDGPAYRPDSRPRGGRMDLGIVADDHLRRTARERR
jgi:outer membrane protein OmpA-like peptidoglycan-associated protein